jgi:hypothetical protein
LQTGNPECRPTTCTLPPLNPSGTTEYICEDGASADALGWNQTCMVKCTSGMYSIAKSVKKLRFGGRGKFKKLRFGVGLFVSVK